MKRFLISGCGRSGTTLLWKLLNCHPDLNIAYEPYDKNFDENLDDYNSIKQPMQVYEGNGPIKNGLLDLDNVPCEKFIFLVRNKKDTVFSLMHRNPVLPEWYDENVKIFYHQYDLVYSMIDKFVRENRDRCILLEYSHMCNNISDVVAFVLFTFLGESFVVKDVIFDNWYKIKVPNWAKEGQRGYNEKEVRPVVHRNRTDDKWLKFIEIYERIQK